LNGVSRNLDGYSKAVSWLKVALPLLGLGILSMLFLVAKETRIEQEVMQEETLAPDGGVETARSPKYSGVTEDGSEIFITAGEVWPNSDGSGRLEGSGIAATFDMPDGERVEVLSEAGSLAPKRDILELRGDVVVTTGSGWTMQSESLDAWLDRTRLESPTSVRTEGPIGTLDAGRMEITRDAARGSTYLMEFSGGVHLIYHP
jgi:lipopolysaccharide export system protein LptC